MHIQQEPKFAPITIVLENKEEAEALWNAVRNTKLVSVEKDAILRRLSNWFSEQASL